MLIYGFDIYISECTGTTRLRLVLSYLRHWEPHKIPMANGIRSMKPDLVRLEASSRVSAWSGGPPKGFWGVSNGDYTESPTVPQVDISQTNCISNESVVGSTSTQLPAWSPSRPGGYWSAYDSSGEYTASESQINPPPKSEHSSVEAAPYIESSVPGGPKWKAVYINVGDGKVSRGVYYVQDWTGVSIPTDSA
jgi:hypothetical protein